MSTTNTSVNEKLSKELREWMATVLPEHKTALLSDEPFFELFKSGIILCELLNKLAPGSVRGSIVRDVGKQRENIDMFLFACRSIGVEGQHIFATADLYEARNCNKVLNCILKVQKRFLPPDGQSGLTTGQPNTDMRNSPRVVLTANDEHELKQQLKYTPELAKAVKDWINGVLEQEVLKGNVADELKSGVVLCQLINKFVPGSVEKMYEGNIPFRQMSNIAAYLNAAEKFQKLTGKKIILFQVSDLLEQKNIMAVLTNIESLAKVVQDRVGYVGPRIADTTQAKNMMGHALLGVAMELDEQTPEQWTPQEQEVIDWANTQLAKAQPPLTIINIQSLQSGIKLITLLKILTGIQNIGMGVVESPRTVMHFMANEAALCKFLGSSSLEEVGITPGDVVNGDRPKIISLIIHIRCKFDLDFMYKLMMQKMEEEEATRNDTDNISDYLPEDDISDYLPDDAFEGGEELIEKNSEISENTEKPENPENTLIKENPEILGKMEKQEEVTKEEPTLRDGEKQEETENQVPATETVEPVKTVLEVPPEQVTPPVELAGGDRNESTHIPISKLKKNESVGPAEILSPSRKSRREKKLSLKTTAQLIESKGEEVGEEKERKNRREHRNEDKHRKSEEKLEEKPPSALKSPIRQKTVDRAKTLRQRSFSASPDSLNSNKLGGVRKKPKQRESFELKTSARKRRGKR